MLRAKHGATEPGLLGVRVLRGGGGAVEPTCWYWEYFIGSFSNTSYVWDSRLSIRG